MKNHLKNESGVTMIILVLMIIVILIISTVGIYTGIDAYKSMRVQTFIAQMQTVKEKINIVQDEYKAWDEYNGTNIDSFISTYNSYTDEDGITRPNKITSILPVTHPDRMAFEEALKEETTITGEDKVLANYFYFTSEDLEKVLGLKNLTINVIINFHTGTFLEKDGVEITTLFGKDAKTYTLEAAINLINRGYFYSDTYLDETDEEVTSAAKISKVSLTVNSVDETHVKLKLNSIVEVISIEIRKENETAYDAIPNFTVTNTIIDFDISPNYVGKYVFKVTGTGVSIESEPFEIVKVNTPKTYNEMKSIVISDTGVAQEISKDSNEWYSYSTADKKWANAMLPDGSMYVWVPRFAYKLYDDRVDIIFLRDKTEFGFGSSQNVTDLGYTVHPAFKKSADNKYTNGEYNNELTGIWISKFDNMVEIYNKGGATDSLLPSYLFRSYAGRNLQESQHISFIDAMKGIRLMEVNLNLYGFETTGRTTGMSNLKPDYTYDDEHNGIDTHLMKNSEYGALLYLTHSQYGIGIISLNFVQDNITGGQSGITNNLQSSTTGNVYGVYDLANNYPDFVSCGTQAYLRQNSFFGVSGVADSNQYINVYPDNIENARIYGDCMVDSRIFGFFTSQVIRQEYFNNTKGILFRGGKTEFDYIATSFEETADVSTNCGIRPVILVEEGI